MVSVSSLLWVLAAAVAGFLIWSAYCSFDSKREERRKAAARLGLKCAQRKATRFANLFVCYGAGDYSGMWKEIKRWEDELHHGIDVIEQEFQAIATAIAAENAALAPVVAPIAATAAKVIAGLATAAPALAV